MTEDKRTILIITMTITMDAVQPLSLGITMTGMNLL